jgi:hypothetical protein
MSQEFQQPGETPGGGQSGAQEFSTPEAEQLESTPEETPVASATVMNLFAAVESQLAQATASAAVGPQNIEDFDGLGNIQGVGVGTGEIELDTSTSAAPGEPALNVYVAAPMAASEVKAVIASAAGVSATDLDSVPVNVIVTGIIEANSFTARIRPVPGGWSIGHCAVTAGTLGCLALGRSAPRNNRLLLLSNNHVIANSNVASLGDSIVSPGRYDGGRCPTDDRIAILERFVPINFSGGANYVDCATGWCWPDRVRREHVYRSGGTLRYFTINRAIAAARLGAYVGKTGRTTELTVGRVIDVASTIRVHYGGGRYALFRDQVAVRANSGNFSAGGDSGSVIWTWDGNRNPVALLFAGGGGVTFANKIHHVVAALDINLYT